MTTYFYLHMDDGSSTVQTNGRELPQIVLLSLLPEQIKVILFFLSTHAQTAIHRSNADAPIIYITSSPLTSHQILYVVFNFLGLVAASQPENQSPSPPNSPSSLAPGNPLLRPSFLLLDFSSFLIFLFLLFRIKQNVYDMIVRSCFELINR